MASPEYSVYGLFRKPGLQVEEVTTSSVSAVYNMPSLHFYQQEDALNTQLVGNFPGISLKDRHGSLRSFQQNAMVSDAWSGDSLI